MSKQKRKHIIKLEIGKFYRVLDGSPGGHPGQIFKIDTQEKIFYAVVTGSMTKEEYAQLGLRKGYIKLTVPTDNNVDISLVKKRPFIGIRDDYGEKEYEDMSFDNNDIYIILKIQNNNPTYGSYYKKRKKRLRNGAAQTSCGSASNK
ncbi:MAG: hypothetical protein J5618_03400 [Bacilli bacterium]|nr:hypothetical protein [Bacilli bacterium]